jgi:radical SAM superfamily enzyme YgiQ (UPF0313 family)
MDLAKFRKFEVFTKNLFKNKKIEKILLINPPDVDKNLFSFDSSSRGRNMNYPPYGLGLISSHLDLIKVSNKILNLNHIVLDKAKNSESEKSFNFSEILKINIIQEITEFKPDMIVITCMFSQTHQALMDVIKEIKLCSEIPIAIGGVHVTGSMSDDKTKPKFLNDVNGVNYIFLNEAEISFKEFVKFVNSIGDQKKITQLIAIDGDALIEFEERMTPDGDDLNVIPNHNKMLSSELTKVGKIGGFFSLLPKEKKLSTVLLNRGCRAKCTFCSVRNFNGIGVRSRTVESAIEELKILKFEHGIDHIMWLDDDFLYNRNESLLLFNEMIKENLNMTWDNTNGVIATSCTEELMNAAAEAGCIGLTVGMESGNREILRKIIKPGTVDSFLKAAEVLSKIEKINARVFLMIGFPNETFQQINDTIDVSRTMNLDWYNVTILQPLPNTVIFDQMLSEGLIGDITFSEMGYNSGTHGKSTNKSGKSIDPLSVDFSDTFNKNKLNQVPNRKELDNIWAYMNYHLNFKRLFQENRKIKLEQQYRYVRNIAELVAPNNAFAIYFASFLHNRLKEGIDESLLNQFNNTISNNPYWRKRCTEFGLKIEHIKNQKYPYFLENN